MAKIDKHMTSLQYLEGIKNADATEVIIEAFNYRKVKALEIIAEELCKLNKK